MGKIAERPQHMLDACCHWDYIKKILDAGD